MKEGVGGRGEVVGMGWVGNGILCKRYGVWGGGGRWGVYEVWGDSEGGR